MLEKLQIQNVGTNEKLDIELSPEVTTLIGKSFIGKSWILRALRLVTLNKPAGTSFISWGTDKAKIRLSVDGKRVIRIRSKTTNTYRLSGKKKPYTAFGNAVPRDIAEILNLSQINFQAQHSTKENRIPFWFCETAGEVSRQLNSIINLELIDSTLSNIASELRKTDLTIKITEEALTKAVQEKKDLLYIEDLNSDLENVEKLQKQYEQDARKRSVIEKLTTQAGLYTSQRENRLEQVSDGLKAISAGKTYLKTADSVEKLSKLIKSGQIQRDILKTRPSSILPLKKLRKKLEQITEQYNRLYNLIEATKIRRQEKCQTETELIKCKKLLVKVADGRCPIRNRPMKK